MYNVRTEALKRSEVLRRRRLREQEERDPYAVPREMRAGWMPPDEDESAEKIQAM